MKKQFIKTTLLSVSTVLLLAACSANQENVSRSNAIASDATKSELKSYEKFEDRVKKAKKRKKRISYKKKELKQQGFCFKDSRSIHYRAEERCK